MKFLVIFALLSVAAQALQAHLSNPHSDHVAIGAPIEFDVVFDACIASSGGLLAANMRVTGGTIAGLTCVDESGSQLYHCAGTLSTGEVITVSVPSGAAVDQSGNANIGNGQTLVFEVSKPITAEFSTNPNTYSVQNPRVQYTVAFNQDVIATDVSPFSFTTTAPGVTVQLESLTYVSASQWQFTAVIPEDADTTVSLSSGAVANYDGDLNAGDAAEPITRKIGLPSVDCQVSDWSEWGTCNGICATVSAFFEVVYPQQTRTRAILQEPSEGGAACPVLVEEQACTDTRLCYDASRPYSGESGLECANCAATDPVQAGSLQEKSGCHCDTECVTRGDCCQAFFTNNCCSEGSDCVARYANMVYTQRFPDFTFPLSCAGSSCSSDAPVVRDGESTYFCYCDFQCQSDNSCCGGLQAKIDACAAGR